jgi:hypothetical protein
LSAVAARALQSKTQATSSQNGDSQSNGHTETTSSAFSVLKKTEPVPQEALVDETTQEDREDETGSGRLIIDVEEESEQGTFSSYVLS